jgi:hypothetical protein
MTARSLRSAYQLKVTLKGVRPPIWRRIQIASSASLEDLHIAIQVVMGWTNSHMHLFGDESFHYGVPDPEYPAAVKNEIHVRLEQVLKKENGRLSYVYDMGDDWEHDIVLEKILPFDPGTRLPLCLNGRRACPPEDVGGMPGYADFLEAIADPSHPGHRDYSEWIGGDWDPEYFDLAQTNDLLREYCD